MTQTGQFLTFPQAFNLAATHYRAGRHKDAREICDKVLAGAPNYADVVHLAAVLQMDAGNFDKAEDLARRAVELTPSSASFVNTLGVVLKKRRRFAEAMACFQRAVDIDPKFAPVYTNIGLIVALDGDYDRAEQAHRRSLAYDPNYVTAMHNIANLLQDAGKLDEALEFFHQALQRKPGDPEIHTHRALCMLMRGDFARGWDEYEWRMQMKSQLAKHSLKSPLWDGRGFEGQTLLVYHEQGFGDVVQMARYLPMVKARGGRVVVACAPPIGKLIEGVEGVDQVVTADAAIPRHHFKVPVMALPRIFRQDIDNIPAQVPYIKAPPATLPGGAGLARVGIVWAGSATHDNDHRRSMPATELKPLLETPGVAFYSLQYGERFAELEQAGLAGRLTRIADAQMGDFQQTAGCIDALDLLITVDTAVAHLAGALGKPVWTLLAFANDFRWLRGRDDTPWYPTMTLYRQSRPMVWTDLVERVTADLAVFAQQRDRRR
ncbi:MAG: tetratricopeptide repeat protein [Reyranellaceae bacterium]